VNYRRQAVLTDLSSAGALGLRAPGVVVSITSQTDSNDGESPMLPLLQEARDCTNNEAWRLLVSQCEPLLYGWLRFQDIQHVDADDLVQETLATLALEAPAFQPNRHPAAFRCWLYKVLINRLRNFRRSQQVRSICHADSELLDQLADIIDDSRSDLARRWDEEHARHIARQMMERIETEFQPKTWQAFRSLAMEGVDAERVAAELGLSLDSVYAAKSRVLRRLRQEAKKALA
jgi:RNA polymerase sigma-70 factor (ECF subfamily)